MVQDFNLHKPARVEIRIPGYDPVKRCDLLAQRQRRVSQPKKHEPAATDVDRDNEEAEVAQLNASLVRAFNEGKGGTGATNA